jgi:predicted phage terminase large subunit-like protein
MTTIQLLDAALIDLMTVEEKQEYAKYLQKQANLADLWTYINNVSPEIVPYDNLVVLCEYLDALLDGRLYKSGPGPIPVKIGERVERSGRREITVPILVHPETGENVVYNLAIYEPPRHGKSLVVSEHFLGYVGTKYPGTKMANASYGDDLSLELAKRLVKNIEDGKPMYGEGVVGGLNASKLSWEMTNGSKFIAGGRASGFTGHGWQVGVADDLLKDRIEANSPTTRRTVHEFWLDTWWTRREPWHDGTPARAILMNTRWHTDDVSGRVVEGADDWCVLRIPALAEEDDILGRAPGEALIPEILNSEQLLTLQERNPQGFAALYQGRPFLAGGNLIHEPFNHCSVEGGLYKLVDRNGAVLYVPEADCFRFQVIDLAATEKKTSDWTVLGTFDVTPEAPRKIILRGLKRMRITTEDHEGMVVDEYRRMRARFIAVEDRTFGTNLINRLRKRGGLIVRSVEADKDKVTRALPLDSLIRGEEFWWIGEASWVMDLEEEILTFPDTEHDDQVDVLAYAARVFEQLPRHNHYGRNDPPANMGERIQRHMEGLRKTGRRRYEHPELGSLR